MVGMIKEMRVHFRLCVSFFIVRHVVEHGQCINEKRIVLTAVIQVHPLSVRSVFRTFKSFISRRLPSAIYAIIMIGTTISFAGKPSMNASSITPSKPISLANGSRNPEQCASNVIPLMFTFAISHIRRPAGAATITARLRTNSVRSNTDLTRTRHSCGLRYGGSSSVNEDGIPFKIVIDNSFDMIRVVTMPSTITIASKNAGRNDDIIL